MHDCQSLFAFHCMNITNTLDITPMCISKTIAEAPVGNSKTFSCLSTL